MPLLGQQSQKASNPLIPDKTQKPSSIPERQRRSSRLLCATYLAIEDSAEEKCDGRILGIRERPRKFTLSRHGLLAPLNSHPVGGPQHHPHMRLVLVETFEAFEQRGEF